MPKPLNYARLQRIEFIKKRIELFGYVRRSDITKQFDVSICTASHDLKRFMKLYPERLVYNYSLRCYIRSIDDLLAASAASSEPSGS